MKQGMTGGRPGLSKLKINIEKNKNMVRKAAPVIGENKGMLELEIIGEALYKKTQAKDRKRRKYLLSRIP